MMLEKEHLAAHDRRLDFIKQVRKVDLKAELTPLNRGRWGGTSPTLFWGGECKLSLDRVAFPPVGWKQEKANEKLKMVVGMDGSGWTLKSIILKISLGHPWLYCG